RDLGASDSAHLREPEDRLLASLGTTVVASHCNQRVLRDIPAMCRKRGQRVLAEIVMFGDLTRATHKREQPARAVVRRYIPDIVYRSVAGNRAACRQDAHTLDIAGGNARVHAHGV